VHNLLEAFMNPSHAKPQTLFMIKNPFVCDSLPYYFVDNLFMIVLALCNENKAFD